MDNPHLRPQEAGEIDRPWTFVSEGRVASEGIKPFVQTAIVMEGEEKPILIGQVTPGEAVVMGVRIIQTGLEAERDAGLVRYLRSENMPDAVIAQLLEGMRRFREQWDLERGDIAAEQPDHEEPESSDG